MDRYLALTLNGFREARRNRVTVVVAMFAIALLLFSTLLTNLSISTFDRVLTDVGLGAMSVMLILLAVYLSSGMLGREIERRTLFMVVTKPISRAGFLLGRFAGNMLTLLVLLLVMAVIFFGGVLLYGTSVTQAQFVAIGMLWFELLVLSSIGVALSSFTSPLVSGAVTVAMYFAGHLSKDIYALGEKAETGALQLLAKGIYYVLPNLDRLNYRLRATYELSSPLAELAPNMIYALAYSAAVLGIALIVFQRRDFR